MTRPACLSLKVIVLLAASLFPAVPQVRVVAQRAGIYVEPDRRSTRLDIVRQGTVLNLLQPQKVKESWYYVSYISSRFGGRMSGFIRDTAVEDVEEGPPATPPSSVKEAPPPASNPVPAAPALETERPKPEPKPASITITSATVALPRARRLNLPRRLAGPADIPWAIIAPTSPPAKPEPAPVAPAARPAPSETLSAAKTPPPSKEEPVPKPWPEVATKEPPVPIVTSVVARAPRYKRLTLPRGSPLPQDAPWAVIKPPAPAPKPAAPLKPEAPEKSAGTRLAASSEKPAPTPPTRAKARPPEPPPPKPAEPRTPKVVEPVRPKPEPPLPNQAVRPKRRGARLGFGAGFGPSYGGAGGSLLLPLGRGLALHAGYGVYPTTLVYSETDWVSNEALWSLGLRVYPLPSSDKLAPYIDAVYGGFIVEAAQVITGIYDYSFVYDRQQKALQGPSLLAGLELRFGRFVLNGGLGASYSLTKWEILKTRLFFAFEAGLGVRL